MSRTLFLITLFVAGLLSLLVSAMNPQRVDIELALGHVVSPLGLALVCAFALGLIGGLFWRSYWLAALLNERGRLRRALRTAEARARSAAAESDAS